MNILEIFGWICAILSFVGGLYVAKKNSLGLWLWIISNAGWIIIDFSTGLYSQGCLFIAYMGTTMYSIWEWRKDKSKEDQEFIEPIL